MAVDDAGGDVLALAVDGGGVGGGDAADGPGAERVDLAVVEEDPGVVEDAFGPAGPDGGVGEEDGVLVGDVVDGVGAEGVPAEVFGGELVGGEFRIVVCIRWIRTGVLIRGVGVGVVVVFGFALGGPLEGGLVGGDAGAAE
ncbi:MAG: hypothetical protein R3B49_01240 [Phycisphaerales bacterium]